MRISTLITFTLTTLFASSAVFGEENIFHITEIRSYQMYDYYFDEQGRRVEIPNAACLPGDTGVSVPNTALNRQMMGVVRSNAYHDCQNNPPIPEDKEKFERVFCFFVGDVEIEDGSASRYCSKNDKYELFTAFVRYACDCFGIPVKQEAVVVQNSEVNTIFSSEDLVRE